MLCDKMHGFDSGAWEDPRCCHLQQRQKQQILPEIRRQNEWCANYVKGHLRHYGLRIADLSLVLEFEQYIQSLLFDTTRP